MVHVLSTSTCTLNYATTFDATPQGTDVVGASKRTGAWGGTKVSLFPVVPAGFSGDVEVGNSTKLADNATVVATRADAIATSWSIQGPMPHQATSLVEDPLVM